jgi:hypothetical protein
MAQEVQSPVGSVAITWAAVGSTPVVGGDASGLARIRLTRKALLKQLVLRLSGTYDQSVGAETQATEGNPVLIQSVQLDVNGRKIRIVGGGGGFLYEVNRIVNQGAGPKSDPSLGVAAGKLFSSTLFYDMSEYDAVEDHVRDFTLLDLANFDNVFLEVQFGAFSRYVFGNTQANMSATLVVEELDILGIRRLPQLHFEARKVQVASLVNAQVDAALDLVRRKTVTRALLLRYGTLSSTPIITGNASLTQLQVKGTLNQGTTQDIKQKMPIAAYQQTIGVGRNGISLLAGYVEIDFANNRKAAGKIVGENYTDFRLLFDNTALAGGSMEVYQLVTAR